MSHTRKSPYLTDVFWIELMNINLSKPDISESFRKRCEAIKAESEDSLKVHFKQINLHYPRERS